MSDEVTDAPDRTAPAPAAPTLPDTGAYLARIGARRPVRADADALRELHVRHLLSVPFENLSIHLGEDIVLDEKALVGKVVDDRRGGFCYELNTAFAVLLRELGYRVSLLQARVVDAEGRVGIPYDHMALLVVTADGERWLADVGFGDHSHYPLAFDERGDQEDPGGRFRVQEAADGDLEVLRDGKPQYRLEVRPRELADFAAGAWYHRTSPDSHFPRSLVCSLLTEEGRITLSERKLITRAHGERVERVLDGDEEVRGAYRELFGIVLDELPVVGHDTPNS
ncbi:arylamine N-acetyltransferase family protein [Streptomyces narbonensis]|uniref:arylamine N-acetyltransferase family protein n=1 Tax=Streptomyces narbonensis TaxID=67333 RepID=UPI0016796EB3|nr:arylamine N-acetyltransferase [Streptomyces narbonensis]GGV93408.1 N-hydroxyarylamine O-acetyltransferase [Streptomyces narbonensis]